jgi:C4-dicarboxylate-binding protein DctP
MKMNRREFSLSLGAVALGAGAGGPARAQGKQVTIRFPVEYSLEVTPGIANSEFKKMLEAKTKGRIKVELYPDGSLYKGIDLLQAVVRGDADMTTLVSAYWAAISPKISAFDLPYAFPSHEAFYKAADDAELAATAFAEMEGKGVKVLAMLPYDYVVPGSRDSALIKLEDFKGQKMRAIGKINSATLQAFGATPVPINITEVATSIQQGVINGLNTPVDVYSAYKLAGIIKHVNYAKYYFAFYPWAMNKKAWDALGPEDQKIVEETVKEVAKAHRARARKAATDAIAALKAGGVSVHEQTADERKAWEAATTKVWADAEAQFGKPLIDKLRSYGA